MNDAVDLGVCPRRRCSSRRGSPAERSNGRINFERNESGAIEIRNGVVRLLDDDYVTYKQEARPGGVGGANCAGDNLVNVITTGVVTSVDPAMLVGQRLPRVVGILRPVSIGSFNVRIIYPRGAGDLTPP